jgi:hypothetical protein
MLRVYRQPRTDTAIVVCQYPTWAEIMHDPQACIRTLSLNAEMLRHAAGRLELCIRVADEMTLEQLSRIDGFLTTSQYEQMKEMEKKYRE